MARPLFSPFSSCVDSLASFTLTSCQESCGQRSEVTTAAKSQVQSTEERTTMNTEKHSTVSPGGTKVKSSMSLFLETHGIPVGTAARIAVGVGTLMLVCLVAVFLVWRRSQAARIDAEASRGLLTARTQANLESLMERCSASPLAPLIMLKQAQTQYSDGNYELSMNTCERFLKQYPKHELAPAAELGLVFCREAFPGGAEDAQKGFAAFIAKNPSSFLVNEAIFGRARCLEQLGRNEEARQVYEDFKVAHPTENVWQDRADAGLRLVEADLRRSKETVK